jgi:phospholipase C
MAILTFEAFFNATQNGTLPEISIVIPETELSEHPPHPPQAGAFLWKQLVENFVHSPIYKDSVMIISYDGISPFTPETYFQKLTTT